jgi:thiol:disulfide interchange protein DsbC
MRIRLLHFLTAILFVLTAASQAGAFGGGGEGCGAGTCTECHSMDKGEAESLLKGLVEKVHGVDFSIVPGLWRVEVESKEKRGAIYIDFSKEFVVSGRIMRLADWADVSSGKVQKQRKVDPSGIPLDDAVLLGEAGATTKVIVFTDPQCPYCGKLHQELEEVVRNNPDIAFYMMLFPLKSHPDAYRISKSVICAGSLELLEDSFAGKTIPDPSCKTDAVDRNMALAKKLGIRSTPTLVLPDGRILSGFKPAVKLVEILREPASGKN